MTPDSQLLTHDFFLHRCLELASLGAGSVAPNPMVGAVLVYNGKIIGEGYHKKFGEAHAEVNCIKTVKEENRKYISHSVLYVSLEPCSHFGKTPPCTDLILQLKIPKVIIGIRDPFNKVNGKGIEKLIAAGVEVEVGVLENEFKELNKRFFTFQTKHRPYIILKWAESSDHFIATSPPAPLQRRGAYEASGFQQLFISNENTNCLVHKWRSEEASILVGTNTALHDDPELTARLWPGNSPVRLVLDLNLRLPRHLKIFNNKQRTIIFNIVKHEEVGNLLYYQLNEDDSLVHQISRALYGLNIQSMLVEGGARLLQTFIDEGLWDEARIISNGQLKIGNGLSAPVLSESIRETEMTLLNDKINFYQKN